MSAIPQPTAVNDDGILPIVRVPILDKKQSLFAYELLFPRPAGTDIEAASLAHTQATLSAIADGSLKRLVRDNRAFLHMSRDLLLEHSDILRHNARLGASVGAEVGMDEQLLARLRELKGHGCLFVLEDFSLPPDPEQRAGVDALLRIVQFAKVAVDHRHPVAARAHMDYVHGFGVKVIVTGIDSHETYVDYADQDVDGFQGKYLLRPERVDMPRLAPSKLGVLRLMGALQDPDNGPVELGKIIRDDAILSYKLLGCVNSAYFALPRQLKSVEQAAVFFGVNRMRNWIFTMAVAGMDERPPELLRLALIRAHMCEKLARGIKPELQEMAFTAGLFSLLDTLMNVSMAYVMEHLPLAIEIREALLEGAGPFAPLLDQIRHWEQGELETDNALREQHLQTMAAMYVDAANWADHVYAFADGTVTAEA
ncbi:EAL and modified HD-GYP domain-containing signal transduction protein [Luteibacter sp. Sphag1AF]|uniref:EAL and HDOD domain-containing protein n=1 Tax=Luteibacter sp. Sphag1AF TaxID=2587031 RepID=UPI0016072255|nr:HDOD domain-containing protein [Luteibacter sp. Sphag1AF]MBB3225621.1 EAL and modified HD-GYP domain-containing signal transduction protein [Luteibacter sp. Sphag1AF]